MVDVDAGKRDQKPGHEQRAQRRHPKPNCQATAGGSNARQQLNERIARRDPALQAAHVPPSSR